MGYWQEGANDSLKKSLTRLDLRSGVGDIQKILIANRGEIACRILQSCHLLGISVVSVYSEADANAPHVRLAEEVVLIGPAPAKESYLNIENILKAARETRADAIHPGYGFLSESPEFAEACEREGLLFIGPTAQTMRQFSHKHVARRLAMESGVPVLPGSDLINNAQEAHNVAEQIGYPLMVKCMGGGGGIGIECCTRPDQLDRAIMTSARRGSAAFGEGGVFLEKALLHASHIEVQIIGDGKGEVLVLGDRECSIQRRNQKILEEAGAPFLDKASPGLGRALHEAAACLGKAVAYRNVGTVEFLVDEETEEFYFLEVNTRLQVEHPVSEMVLGIDLVAWMIRVAAGETLHPVKLEQRGHAVEVRICAEDPSQNWRPCAGTLTEVVFPDRNGVRYDSWIETGTLITTHYDSLLGKVISYGENREQAINRLQLALDDCRVGGIPSNLEQLRQIVKSEAFRAGNTPTTFINQLPYLACAVMVVDGGVYSTIQDYPGRVGYWNIGVPPSGPMDDLAFRIGGRLVGNEDNRAGIEVTYGGLALRFLSDTIVAITGADMAAQLDGKLIRHYASISVRAGSVLTIGNAQGQGCRGYVAIRGGINVPPYLGSRATFPLAGLGGLQGTILRAGDLLPIGAEPNTGATHWQVPESMRPCLTNHWEVGVLYGPHGAPDFFTEEGIGKFFASDWQVHHNSNRLGIRLIGPKLTWARADGGEAGLHPSNIHDSVYAIGSVNFTGDMPIILTCDGPSLGGFVCPATVIESELWKIGQVRAGDTIRFRRKSYEGALAGSQEQEKYLDDIEHHRTALPGSSTAKETHSFEPTILHEVVEGEGQPRVVYRMAGDRYLLIEYGPMVLDFALRFRVYSLMDWLETHQIAGVLELSPGIRSLQIRYDQKNLHISHLLKKLVAAEQELSAITQQEVSSRIIRLPLAFDDCWNHAAVAKYSQSVRSEAPYLPSNIEFITRINGLDSVEELRRILYSASYMVFGLGDVYLGAPCAVPLDPRHRIITSKYNPARTHTPEGSVGIGGAYMCIYGMDSPGGYQLVGRTLPIWDRFTRNPHFESEKPWLLRLFDQIQFYPVSDADLKVLRSRFSVNQLKLEIRQESFDLNKYQQFLLENEEEISAFTKRREHAFALEREHWQEQGLIGASTNGNEVFDERHLVVEKTDSSLPDGYEPVTTLISGMVLEFCVAVGERVDADQTLMIIEAMKMEFQVKSPDAGVVHDIVVTLGRSIVSGDILCIVKTGT